MTDTNIKLTCMYLTHFHKFCDTYKKKECKVYGLYLIIHVLLKKWRTWRRMMFSILIPCFLSYRVSFSFIWMYLSLLMMLMSQLILNFMSMNHFSSPSFFNLMTIDIWRPDPHKLDLTWIILKYQKIIQAAYSYITSYHIVSCINPTFIVNV